MLCFRRGPPEEDAPISQPLAIVISVDEDAESSIETDSQSPLTPLQNTPAQLTLFVEGDTACDSSVQSRVADRNFRPVSPDTGSISLASIFQVDNHGTLDSPDPRGEAPRYFEAVGQADDDVNRSLTYLESPNTSATLGTVNNSSLPALPLLSSPRRLGFRALLDRTAASRGHHARPGSAGSGTSSTTPLPDSPSHTHNRGASATSLVSILGLSRQKSSASHNSSRPNLVSPSMISLNSISAPLTHTAIRIEFAAYPRQGLTPEQLQLISSREGLAKFGRPYGPDAVAFASMSAVDLDTSQRPPHFEAAVGETGDSGGASTGATRELSVGAADEAQLAQETVMGPDEEVPRSADSSQPRLPGSLPAEQNTNATLASTEGRTMHDVQGEDKSEEALIVVHKGKAKEISVQESNNLPMGIKGHGYITCSVPEVPLITEQTPTSEVETDLEAIVTGIEVSKTSDIILPTSSSSAPQSSAIDYLISSPTKSASSNSLLANHGQPKPGQPAQSNHILERSESHASLASRGTFQTAVESMRSRKVEKWMGATDDEREDDLSEFCHDTVDDGNTMEGDDDKSSTPVLSQNREPNLGHGGQLTEAASAQPTPILMQQDRHVSIATITYS